MAPKRTQFCSRPLLLLLTVLVPAALSFENNFDFYPANSRACLNDASKSSHCTGNDSKDSNQCLCRNGGDFITTAAKCLGKNDRDELSLVYATMVQACLDSNTPIVVSNKMYMDAANEDDTSSTTSSSSTTTSTSISISASTATSTSTLTTASGTATPTQSGSNNGASVDNKSSGLPQGAMIGIAVGASVVGMLAIGGLVLFLRHRHKKPGEENSPMMAHYYKNNTATTFPPTEPSPSLAVSGSDIKASWGSSPSPAHLSTFSKSPMQYAGPFVAPTPQDSPAIPGVPSPTFEMDASAAPTPAPGEVPIEMEGSAPPKHR